MFPIYIKTKDSGVEWLGKVAEHWTVKRLGHFFTERREKVSDKNYAPLSVTKNGIVPQLETAAKTDDGDNRKKVSVGDFVVNGRSDRKGSSGISGYSGSVSLINIVLIPKNINTRFAHHLLRSYPFQEEFYRYGKGIVADLWSTNYSEMRNILLALPEQSEQAAIASFLDRKTALIDDLIAKRERQIELLQEHRMALITRVVTKGLNPDVPMKDSGAKWLGAIPAHWNVKKLKRISPKITVGVVVNPSTYVVEDGTVPFIRGIEVHENFINTEKVQYISHISNKLLSKSTLNTGDIIAIRVGDPGIAAVIPETLNGSNCASLLIIRMSSKFDSNFICFGMNSLIGKYQVKRFQDGAAQEQINVSDAVNIIFPIPELEEQKNIADYLRKEACKVDKVVDNLFTGNKKLLQYRQSLISAAVTGKIDVRGDAASDTSLEVPA